MKVKKLSKKKYKKDVYKVRVYKGGKIVWNEEGQKI